MQIAIPIYEGFTALDAIGPYEVLQRLPEAEVVFCSEERGPVRTEQGMLAIVADRTLGEGEAAAARDAAVALAGERTGAVLRG